MNHPNGHSTTEIASYVESLVLPPAYEAAPDEEQAPPPKFVEAAQMVSVGAQLTEFSAKVAPELREAISDSLLLAQLAANAAAKAAPQDDVFRWYSKYREILNGIGWKTMQFEEQVQTVNSSNLGVHSAIIPVVTAMLAPGVAASAMVVSLLNGLKQMDDSSKWITLFDRASQHAHGAKFQVAYVDAPDGSDPMIQIACFAIDASKTVTQVLFFRVSQDSATLRNTTGTFSVGRDRLLASQPKIAERVTPFVSDFLADVPLSA